VNTPPDTPDIALSSLDAFLWEAAAEGKDRVARDLLKDGAIEAQSPITTWTLIERSRLPVRS
jgi:hypothetical protein